MPTTQVAVGGRTFTYQYNIGRTLTVGEGFYYPIAVARGSGDLLYVANQGDEWTQSTHITKCTLNHEWICDIGSPGTGDGQFLSPGGLALDSTGNVYVTDQSTDKIVIFDSNGAFLGKWGTSGQGAGELARPSGISFDKDDALYIADTSNHRIQKFTKEGKFLAQWGESGFGEGQLNMPWGITLDSNGNVYVADWGNDRVQKFNNSGEFLASFGETGSGKTGLSRPSDVAVDKDGDIYVVDWGNERVQVLDADGGYLATFVGNATDLSPWATSFLEANDNFARALARAGREHLTLMRRPTGVVVDDDYKIIIVEAQRDRLQIYLKDLEYEDPQFNL